MDLIELKREDMPKSIIMQGGDVRILDSEMQYITENGVVKGFRVEMQLQLRVELEDMEVHFGRTVSYRFTEEATEMMMRHIQSKIIK